MHSDDKYIIVTYFWSIFYYKTVCSQTDLSIVEAYKPNICLPQ